MHKLPLLCLILFILLGFSYAQKNKQDSCDDIAMKKPLEVFASFDGGKWKKYPSVKAIPAKAEAGFDRAEVFRAVDGRYKVHMFNSSEETGMFNDYCFASDRTLITIKSDFTGIWGWGARREFRMENGRVKESPTVFYNPDTGKPIPKPEYDASLDEYREVKIYRTISQLPFKVAEAQAGQAEPHDLHYCENVERIEPNLVLDKDAHVFGRLTDQSGSPFSTTKVELREFVTEQKQASLRTMTTDSDGHYDLGQVGAGRYRLLLSATRGFKQAERLDCYAQRECELNVVLDVNPTDMPGAGCPVR